MKLPLKVSRVSLSTLLDSFKKFHFIPFEDVIGEKDKRVFLEYKGEELLWVRATAEGQEALVSQKEMGIIAIKGKTFQKSPIQEYGKRAIISLFCSSTDQWLFLTCTSYFLPYFSLPHSHSLRACLSINLLVLPFSLFPQITYTPLPRDLPPLFHLTLFPYLYIFLLQQSLLCNLYLLNNILKLSLKLII